MAMLTLDLGIANDCAYAFESTGAGLLEVNLRVDQHVEDSRHNLRQTRGELLGCAASHCTQYLDRLYRCKRTSELLVKVEP